jgi:hypothetical protein
VHVFVGFLESIKLPEQDRRFLFRQEFLSSIKYSISSFSKGSKGYYPNLFYLEGEEGNGKTWLLNQVGIICKDRTLALNATSVRFESKTVILSDVLGIVNFLVQLRHAVVNSDPTLEPAFAKFDDSYKAFLNGTLSDDNSGGAISIPEVKTAEAPVVKQVQEEDPRAKQLRENAATDKAKTMSRAGDAKSRLASLRSSLNPNSKPPATATTKVTTIETKENPPTGTPLIPGHVAKAPEPAPQNIPTTQPHSVAKKPLTSQTTAYSSFNSISEKEIPRKRSGEADVKAIAKNITSALEALKRGVVKQVDYKSILLKRFLQAFDAVCNHRKIVLLIDEFEKLQPIFNFFFNVFLKNLRTEFILVIASQLDMEKELKEKYDTNLHYMYMYNFNFFNIDEYLRKFYVTSEPSIVEEVLELTKGSPIGLALVGGAFQNFKGDAFKTMKFLGAKAEGEKDLRHINVITLDSLPAHDKKVIILLSLIKTINYELIEHIAGVFNAENLIQSLAQKYPFVEETGIHDLVKRFTRTYAKYETTSLYEEIHRLAFNYFKNKLEEEPNNKEYILDSLYYQFRMNEDGAYTNLLAYISQFISTDVHFCEELVHGIALVGISKEMRNRIATLKDSLPYVILKDYNIIGCTGSTLVIFFVIKFRSS